MRQKKSRHVGSSDLWVGYFEPWRGTCGACIWNCIQDSYLNEVKSLSFGSARGDEELVSKSSVPSYRQRLMSKVEGVISDSCFSRPASRKNISEIPLQAHQTPVMIGGKYPHVRDLGNSKETVSVQIACCRRALTVNSQVNRRRREGCCNG